MRNICNAGLVGNLTVNIELKIESAPRHTRTQSHSTYLSLRKYIGISFLIKVALEVNGYFVNIIYTPPMFSLASTQTSQKLLNRFEYYSMGEKGTE